VRRQKLTYEEFLQWCDEDTWAEWMGRSGPDLVQEPLPAMLDVLRELGSV